VISGCPLSATKRRMHRSKRHHYSITSSAMARSVGGISIPSALAVVRLMTSSNLLGCRTLRSAGAAPLRNPAGVDASLTVYVGYGLA
jgi:hypothetical protein